MSLSVLKSNKRSVQSAISIACVRWYTLFDEVVKPTSHSNGCPPKCTRVHFGGPTACTYIYIPGTYSLALELCRRHTMVPAPLKLGIHSHTRSGEAAVGDPDQLSCQHDHSAHAGTRVATAPSGSCRHSHHHGRKWDWDTFKKIFKKIPPMQYQ